MKKLFTLMLIIFFTLTISAQVPQKMSYQAVIRNGTALVVSTSVPMDINIWKDAVGSTMVYTESQSPSTNVNGVVSIEIGGGDPAAFALINWSAGLYFIETVTDLSAVGGGTVTGSSQLLSVPYALNAKNGFTRYIGELYGGGIIVAVWKNSLGVEEGLIASLTDISGSSAYSNVTTLIGVTAQSTVDGQSNTAAIIGQTGHTASAALLCTSHNGGGFADWYLPAILELNLCYDASFIVSTVLGQANGFSIPYYWSSTETDATFAWYKNFHTGLKNSDAAKGNSGRVRAVRRF